MESFATINTFVWKIENFCRLDQLMDVLNFVEIFNWLTAATEVAAAAAAFK